jgi:nucleoside phosphorylase
VTTPTQKPRQILLCFAIAQEARPFRRLAKQYEDVAILVTGMGRRNADRALRAFVTHARPAFVLNGGFAGGLNPALATGDIVIAEAANSAYLRLLDGATFRPARIVCLDRFLSTVDEKRAVFERTQADAVDMEFEAIRQVCAEEGIPCANVRIVFDAAHEDLPWDFNSLMTSRMTVSYWRLAWALLKSPRRIRPLMRFVCRCSLAAQDLAAALAEIVGHLRREPG